MARSTYMIFTILILGSRIGRTVAPDACEHHICHNDGDCYVTSDDTLACECEDGYAGRECQEDCAAYNEYACVEKCITSDRRCDLHCDCEDCADEYEDCDDASGMLPPPMTDPPPTDTQPPPTQTDDPSQPPPTHSPTMDGSSTASYAGDGGSGGGGGGNSADDTTLYVIIAVLIIAVLLLLAVLFAVLCWRRRKRQKRKEQYQESQSNTASKEKQANLTNPVYAGEKDEGDRESIYDEINEDKMRRAQSLKAQSAYASLDTENQYTHSYEHMNTDRVPAPPQRDNTYTGLQSNHDTQYSQLDSSTSTGQPNADNTYTGSESNPETQYSNPNYNTPNAYLELVS